MNRRHLIISVVLTATILTAVFFALEPIDRITAVHTTLMATSGVTNTLDVHVVQSANPKPDTFEPLTLYITATYHGQIRSLTASDITLTEIEDSAGKITTPTNPTEIGNTNVFSVELTPSGAWKAGDRYTVSITVSDPIDTHLRGFTIETFVVGQTPTLDLPTVVEPENLNGVTVTTGGGASFGAPSTIVDLPPNTKANIVGLLVENNTDEARKYFIEVGFNDAGTFSPVYAAVVILVAANTGSTEETAFITIPSPGKAVPEDAEVQVRAHTTAPNPSPPAKVKVWLQMVKIDI